MNKFIKMILVFIILIILTGLAVLSYYIFELTPVSNDDKTIIVEIPKGSTGSNTSIILKNSKLIRNTLAFKIYIRAHNINNIHFGTYKLNKAMGTKKIVQIITTPNSNGIIKLLFKEGSNMRAIAKVIAKNTYNKEVDVYSTLNDTKYIDSLIKEYWFLSKTINDKDIYYPLEGYLAPNTYHFSSKYISVKQIFEKMLDQTDKVLTPYKSKLGKYTIHEYLTLASMIEEEGKTLADKKDIAGVFNNRLAKGMSLGSDVTTYYAIKLDNYVRDLKAVEIDTYNPYNTRGPQMNGKLPIGPICGAGEDSIKAAFEPNINNYLYFVADKNRKVYFTTTYAEHRAKVAELKALHLWYEY